MNKKFELLADDTVELYGRKLFRIRAKVSFGIVGKGDLGGYVEKDENLSENGNAWVYGNAEVYGNADVSGNAMVSGNARVKSQKDYIVFKNSWLGYHGSRHLSRKLFIGKVDGKWH